ncbi:MAG: molecular chaperone HtpG [Desulfuromonadales bacterium]|nr:molecular chaperone HtpG [Desulfuromonadales bacterium]
MAKKKSTVEKGAISIHTENIFPIIKKWLYSDKEIFLRELVSNGVDAIHKLQHINLVEGLKISDEYKIDITLNKEAGTLSIIDNGIGMTMDEVRNYINQIAFSSAEEFLEKYKTDDKENQIIGHFGLGFYSSFMVASKVEIKTLSYQKEAKGAHWVCDGSTSYELEEFDKKERGTEIILHLSDDEKEFLEVSRLRGVLTKYCNFLPVSITLEGEVVNDRNPLWTKSPSEVTDEEYKEFYKKLYPFSEEPLFWIHLNIDFPFNLKGIVYFPRLTNEFDVTKSHIKLFCNQVFVSDNCPELIPEFLTPLQGCLDAPDLPLNVSRSYLQNEPQVRKINEVLSSRVAAKIVDLSKKDKEAYTAIWDDIHTFVKYGILRDEKFYDKVKDHVLYRSTGEMRHTTLNDYLERAKATHENTIYYANDEAGQSTYLKIFKGQGNEVVILDHMIDNHFVSFLEMKNNTLKFQRVDADLTQNILEEGKSAEQVEGSDEKSRSDQMKLLFEGRLKEKEQLTIRVESLKDASVPAMILLSEQSRRFKEMTKMMGQSGMGMEMPDEQTLVVNLANPVIKNLADLQTSGKTADAEVIADQVCDLARLAHQGFSREQMETFLERSNKILEMVGKE